MKGVCVELESLSVSSPQRSPVLDCSKDDGHYELKMMPAGQYRIVANRSGKIPARERFPKVYYPGTIDRTKATVITVVDGQHATGLDIRIPSLARRVSIRGRVLFQDGNPASKQEVMLTADTGTIERTQADEAGYFRLITLFQASGELRSEMLIFRDEAAACPHFGATFHPNGVGASLKTPSVRIAAESDLENINLTFPFRSCEKYPQRRK